MTEYEGHHRGSREGVLTEDDLKRIKEVACACPHGLTAEDVFRIRGVLDTWDRIQMSVGGVVIKVILALVVAIGVLVAWITNGGPKS